MSFEVHTGSRLTLDVEAILVLLLLLVWWQNTRVKAVVWWASAHLLRAASVLRYGLYCSVPDLLSIDLANVLLFSSFGVTWNGARDRKSTRLNSSHRCISYAVFCLTKKK